VVSEQLGHASAAFTLVPTPTCCRICRTKLLPRWKQPSERPVVVTHFPTKPQNINHQQPRLLRSASRERRYAYVAQIRSDHRSAREHMDDSYSIRLRPRKPISEITTTAPSMALSARHRSSSERRSMNWEPISREMVRRSGWINTLISGSRPSNRGSAARHMKATRACLQNTFAHHSGKSLWWQSGRWTSRQFTSTCQIAGFRQERSKGLIGCSMRRSGRHCSGK
jgi:hypothetical protein